VRSRGAGSRFSAFIYGFGDFSWYAAVERGPSRLPSFIAIFPRPEKRDNVSASTIQGSALHAPRPLFCDVET
jgi:hypothetical protein